MAWNPEPEVAAARDFGQRFGADQVVVFFTNPNGQVGYASYGKTRRLCDQARSAADEVFEGMAHAFARAGGNSSPEMPNWPMRTDTVSKTVGTGDSLLFKHTGTDVK